jgi:hypothetical protein
MGKAHAAVGRVRSAKGRPPRRPCLRESVRCCAARWPRYAKGHGQSPCSRRTSSVGEGPTASPAVLARVCAQLRCLQPRYANGRRCCHRRPLCRAIPRCRARLMALRRLGFACLRSSRHFAAHDTPWRGLRTRPGRSFPFPLPPPSAWHPHRSTASLRPLGSLSLKFPPKGAFSDPRLAVNRSFPLAFPPPSIPGYK